MSLTWLAINLLTSDLFPWSFYRGIEKIFQRLSDSLFIVNFSPFIVPKYKSIYMFTRGKLCTYETRIEYWIVKRVELNNIEFCKQSLKLTTICYFQTTILSPFCCQNTVLLEFETTLFFPLIWDDPFNCLLHWVFK